MRILIVDEDRAARESIATCLRPRGFDFAAVADVTAAAEAIAEGLSCDRPFAVAFVDASDAGAPLVRDLRGLDPDLNLVAVTAAAFTADPAAGAADKLFHIAKPFAPAEIVQMAAALGERWAIDRRLIAARAQLRAQVILLEERRREIAVAEARAVHSSTHDSMTGAPNRLAFLQALEARARRPGRFAVAMLDLDRFKLVNDTLGHMAGDALIRAMADTLRAQAPADALVARLGGDEFGILFDAAGDRAAVAVCARIVAACAVPVPVMGTTVQSGASAGVIAAEGDGREVMEFVRRADLALNEAKRRGRGGVQLFDEGMDEELGHRRRIEGELAVALERGELALAFQPVVDRDHLAVQGMEALLRWHHPDRGTLAPTGFLAVAEESNLIHALGDWVLRDALAEAARWDRAWVAVNVSPRQFRRHDFARNIATHLADARISASRLQIEVTERAIADDPERAAHTLRRLADLGCRIALDDFGTGDVNLGTLRRLPIDALKIDGTFVHAVGREKGATAFLQALVQLGRAMERDVIAEGVETAAQLQALRIAGASHLQGFFVSPPVAAEAARAMASSDAARTGTDG